MLRSVTVFLIAALGMVVPILVFGNLPYPGIAALIAITAAFTIVSAHGNHPILLYFNVAFTFLVLFPFYLQSIVGWNLTGWGRAPLNIHPAAFISVILFVTIINFTYSFYSPRAPRPPRIAKDASPLLAIIAALACAFIIVRAFGTAEIFSSRIDQLRGGFRSEGPSLLILYILKTIPGWMAYLLGQRRIAAGRGYFSPTVIFMLLMLVVLANPYNTPRYFSLSALIIALFPLIRARLNLNWVVVSFPFLMVIVLPISSVVRHGMQQLQLANIVRNFGSLEFSTMQTLNDGFHFTEVLRSGFGYYSLSGLLIFVPRDIWPDKSLGTSRLVAELAHYPYTGIGMSPIMDAYLDFGYLGVIGFALAVGIAFKYLQTSYTASNGYGVRADIWVIAFTLVPMLCRGSLNAYFISIYGFIIAYFGARFLLAVGAPLSSGLGRGTGGAPGRLAGTSRARTAFTR